MKRLLVVLLLIGLLVSCKSLESQRTDPAILQQAELIAKQETHFQSLARNNEQMKELLDGLNGGVTDLRQWQAKWQQITTELLTLYESNNSILQQALGEDKGVEE